MCPKSRKKEENGHDQGVNVPEVKGERGEQSRSWSECARSQGKKKRTVTIKKYGIRLKLNILTLT